MPGLFRLSLPAAIAAALLLSACGTVQQQVKTEARNDANRIGQDVKRDGAGINRSVKKDLDRAREDNNRNLQALQGNPPKQQPDGGAGNGADSSGDGGRSQVAAVTTPPPSSVRFSELRQKMTDKDAELAGIAMKVSLSKARDNERRGWKNNQTQTTGSITPLRSYSGGDGRNCRDYRETLTIGGSTASRDATACKQPDGSWTAQD